MKAWALITGASDGIGRALAEQLAAEGRPLVLVARRRERLEELAQLLHRRHAVPVMLLVLDLSRPEAAAELDAATAALDLELLVLAAGFGSSGEFLAQPLEAELEQLSLNAAGVLAQCHRLGQRLRQRGGGSLLLFSSVLAFQGGPGAATYAASKAFVQSLGEALAVEWAPLGIRVLVAAPGPVHTGFAARAGMRMGLALQPRQVAQALMQRLAGGHRGTTRPGWLSKLLGWSLASLPRPLRLPVITQVLRGMR